jgi:hypothetical protein
MRAIRVFGGLQLISWPDECAPHADALAIGDGTHLWGRILDEVLCVERLHREGRVHIEDAFVGLDERLDSDDVGGVGLGLVFLVDSGDLGGEPLASRHRTRGPFRWASRLRPRA